MKVSWHCIEFVHTVGWEARDRSDDDLADYEGLLSWCVRRGISDEEMAESFRQHAERQPVHAEAALARAHRLRSFVRETLEEATAGEGAISESRLDEMNLILARFSPDRQLGVGEDGTVWVWKLDPHRLESIFGPVAWSLALLLTSPERDRLKHCDADDCGWFFIDGSRNRSRRWCDMSDCGSREKSRRFRSRT